MELKDFKSAWSKFSSDDANKHQLGEQAIYDLLKKRTKNLIERIERNIRIGFGVLLFLTLFFAFDDFFFTSSFVAEYELTPLWIQLMEGIGVLCIAASFVYFWLSYRAATKNYSQSNDLAKVLKSIIHILYAYRKLFHLALGILLLVLSISFITGLYKGMTIKAHELSTSLSEVSSSPEMIQRLVLGIVILLLAVSLLFLLFHWGFRKLYGNYIFKLKETQKELDEID
ncbi:hypothetical protein [uncultured Sunxiuqinia sp.]|uniref:hypothetical protein n=1 Tax=uncultured Sunxiuqinia sp. TaxID=1573825 RepID=UPI00262F4EC5|nr:hypothetical protein [uncultured Sunxiuqinia sp.]